MHGMMLSLFADHVARVYGEDIWNMVRSQAGFALKFYFPNETYPDDEFEKLANAASGVLRSERERILEGFGDDTVSLSMAMFSSYFDPQWKTLDVLENFNSVFRKISRDHPDMKHPEFLVSREKDDALALTYNSPRKLCALVRGGIKGLARHYGEHIILTETSCMLQGAQNCQIQVTALSPQLHYRERETTTPEKIEAEAVNCWEFLNCPKEKQADCPAYPRSGGFCWLVADTICLDPNAPQGSFTEKFKNCSECSWYIRQVKNSLSQNEEEPEKAGKV